MTTQRTVRHLALQARTRADAARAALRLEDALRCATLPDDGRRLLVVRRLDLGRLSAGAPAQAWARALEQAFAAAPWRWVRADAPDAGHAAAVWFDDELQALAALAWRVLHGPPPQEWFWPQVLPALREQRAPPAVLAAMAERLAGRPEAPVALPAWAAVVVRAGGADLLADALAALGVARLRAAAGLPGAGQVGPGEAGEGGGARPEHRMPPAAAPRAMAPLPVDPARREAVALIQDLLRRAGALRPTPAARAVAQRPYAASGAAPRPPRERSAGAATEPGTPAPDAVGPAAAAAASTVSTAMPPSRGQRSASVAAGRMPGASPTPGVDLPARASGAGAPRERAVTTLPAADDPWSEARPTQAGGALFLIPVLEHLGFAAALAARGDEAARREAVATLWARLFDRLALPPDDPMRAFASGAGEDAAGADAWLSRVRRWLRLQAGIGLASLARRPGRLLRSPTHADLLFDLAAVDLRVRRAGLDIDPGWVPWLDCIVAYHYLR